MTQASASYRSTIVPWPRPPPLLSIPTLAVENYMHTRFYNAHDSPHRRFDDATYKQAKHPDQISHREIRGYNIYINSTTIWLYLTHAATSGLQQVMYTLKA